MEEIKLEISNPNNVTYKCIVLRKFFYMVFIDASGKKLYIYTATVFGGTKEKMDDGGPLENGSQPTENSPDIPCSLRFRFTDGSGSAIKSIAFSDMTNSFCNQPECIEKVWGTCEKLTSQTEVKNKIKEIYPSLAGSEFKLAVNAGSNILYIEQGDKKTHKCVAIQGDFSSESSSYELSRPSAAPNEGMDGIEFVNWIKTEIELKTSILNKQVRFSVAFQNEEFFTPDFTWYFAPPAGYIVGPDSYVRIGETKEKNAIQSVSDETTVPFEEWISPPESIDERRKSRILLKAAPVTKSEWLSKDKELSVILQVTNPQGPSNRQFFIGLLIAFLLSFCADKTRIDYFFQCLTQNCECGSKCICQNICNGITILVPVLLLLSFVSCILKPQKVLPPRPTRHQRFFVFLRWVGLIAVIALVVYVYGLWLVIPNIMREWFNCFGNRVVLGGCAIAGAVGNGCYLYYCLGRLKRKIYNYV